GVDSDLDAPLDATLVIFDGFANINRYWRDHYLIDRERELLLEAQEQLLYDVASVYYTIRRAEAQVEVLDSSIALQQQRVDDARGREEAGLSRSLDVAQSEAQVSATRVQRIEAHRQVIQARLFLAYLTNAPVSQMQLDDQFDPENTDDFLALLNEAFQFRSELRATENAIRAAQHEVEVALGQYYPGVTIDLSAFLYRESAPDERTWAGVLQVNLPIFNAGRIHADVRTAWSFLREALLLDSQTRRRIRNEVEQDLANLSASIERLRELENSLRVSRLAFDQSEASYRAGLATNLDRVAAQDALLQAQLAFRSEEIDQKLLRIELLRATGVLRETLLESSTTQPTSNPTTRSGR
ncbi:MAG TPA: TolC family protein, partial [Tepidisphaeraceae bacterium]|nr:TolC family protein [Tepidisphaeraceae bacterium]